MDDSFSEKLEQIIEARVTEALAEENANYEKEMLLKQANLLALQSQINPHFCTIPWNASGEWL